MLAGAQTQLSQEQSQITRFETALERKKDVGQRLEIVPRVCFALAWDLADRSCDLCGA